MTHEGPGTADRPFLPAMGRHGLLPLYDAFAQLMGARAVQRRLVAQVGAAPGHTALEIGAGTGTVLLELARVVGGLDLVGLDPDARALARARRRAARAGVAVRLDQGYADRLPYADDSVDRVLSSFMFHHLPDAERPGALAEARRVLAPGGSLHLADIGGEGPGRLGRLMHRFHDHGPGAHPGTVSADQVLALMREAGFDDVSVTGRRRSVVGPVTFYRAV